MGVRWNRRGTWPFDAIVLALSLAAVGTGCSTTPYKNDIATFKTSVEASMTAFELLDKRAAASIEADRMRALANVMPKVDVSDACTAWNDSVEQQIQADIACLADWADHRAAAQPGASPPSCNGASDAVKQGKELYYDFGPLRAKEAEACELLVHSDGGKLAAAAPPISSLVEETPKLAGALREYASALADIADAADKEALNSAIASAKVQITGLAEVVSKKNGGSSTAAGPISDLVGSMLVAALERRRLKALQSTTAEADEFVSTAARLLANASVPMTYVEIGQAKKRFLASVPGGRSAKGAEEWKTWYAASIDERSKYLAAYQDSPIAAFQAMAKAHTRLKDALADPKRQYEAVKQAIADFAAKAEAVKDAVEAAQEADEKDK